MLGATAGACPATAGRSGDRQAQGPAPRGGAAWVRRAATSARLVHRALRI